MGMMAGNDLVDKEKDDKDSNQLEVVIRQLGIVGPEESQNDGDQ